MITPQLEIQPETPIPIGFSPQGWDVVSKKPSARVLDCTAGNRLIWGKNKIRDDVIFTDKEDRLGIKPDLISTWIELPNHFPSDYFKCIIFDPPHQTAGINLTCRWVKDPTGKEYTWYGAYRNKHHLITDILHGQIALSKLSDRLCLKIYLDYGKIDLFLTLFTEWAPVFINEFMKDRTGSSWWVKMVRKKPAYESTQKSEQVRK